MNGRSFSLRSSTRRCARRCVPLRIVKWTRDVGFSTIDYLTLIAYLAGITLFGMRFRRAQRTVRDYFIGARTTSWVVISLSIVATETSTLTLIGVPALVYSDFARPEQGGSFMYLQVVLGYIVARFIISWILIPVMRALAEGVRVFAASLVLSAVLTRSLPGLPHLWLWSIALVGVLTLVYTFEGGIGAVIWTDLIQFVIYIAGSLLAVHELIQLVPGGLPAIHAIGARADKFQVLSFSWNPAMPFTFWAGLTGGTFLTLASHGTDQLLVQRMLTCRTMRDAQKALVMSGFVVLFQFVLFLTIGAMLFAYYQSHPRPALTSNDEIFPAFIVQTLPRGIAGLVIAAIFAAAMSNLSGSLNSLASTSILDFYQPLARRRHSDARLLLLSRWCTAGWGIVLIGIAILARGWGSVFTAGLTVASLVYGPMLGAFAVGVLTRRATERGAIAGIAVSLAVMVLVKLYTPLAWTWYVLVGTIVCAAVACAVSLTSSPIELETTTGSGAGTPLR